MKPAFAVIAFTAAVACLGGGAAAQDEVIARCSVEGGNITWQPLAAYPGLVLTVSCPGGEVVQQVYGPGVSPSFAVSGTPPDGQYVWELRVMCEEVRVREDDEAGGLETAPRSALVQSGSFAVRQGAAVDPTVSELTATRDILHNDDVIITGSLGVGPGCADGESFGLSTVKLKQNNIQLMFEDTSFGGFPSNDWMIEINDTIGGGADYFTIWDVDAGRRPFTIEAGAPANALYVDDWGRIGLGTSTPAVELHIVDGDTPMVRLDQDNSSGYSPQAWEVGGNENQFFIRDATNTSKMAFKIETNTPSSTLCLKSTGYVGIGTWSPGWPLEIETTGEAATFVLDRTDGAMAYINAGGTYVNMGSCSRNHLRLMVDGVWRTQINTDGTLHMASGAYCSIGGVWTNSSSRELKDNIATLSTDKAVEVLAGLEPVTYTYKADKSEQHVGFIAEDVPDLVASADRKGMSPMDVTAVLTKVVQEQQARMEEQQRIVEQQQQVIASLQTRLDAIEAALD